MNATKLTIAHNETRRYMTIRGNGDVSLEKAREFAKKALDSFGVGDTWQYIDYYRIGFNTVIVMFERVAST